MMKKKRIILAIGCIFSLVLAGCGSSGGPGPRTWIDTPLDGSTLPLAPVVVRSHAASESGTTSAALYVNGAQVRVDNVPDASAQLVEISQVWQPEAQGDYQLQVIAVDQDGNEGRSATVRVSIGTQVENPVPNQGGEPPEATDVPESNIPPSLQDNSQPPAVACQAPTFTFSVNANCRAGPGTAYGVDASFMQGQSAQIEGRNNANPRWWWVAVSASDHCWVADSTGAASCLVSDVPVIAAPPPPVVIEATDEPTDNTAPPAPAPPSPPSAPYKLSVQNHVCAGSTYNVTLAWGDTSGNEAGFRVYRDTVLIATLGSNATGYTDSPPTGGPYYYMVEAFNSAGAAQSNSAKDDGCIF